jgi:phenylalanine-4-hydroxylase
MELQELSQLTIQDFSGLLNREFKIKFESNVIINAELIEVKEFNNYSPLERKPFAITFRTQQKNEYYPDLTFAVFHPEKGEIPMFLSPKGFDEVGMKYEAVFS